MNRNTHKLASVLGSIVGIAVFIGLFILGLIFFSYLLIIGGIIGLVLFLIGYIRAKFFIKRFQADIKKEQAKQQGPQLHKGRTIDHE